MLKYFPFLLTSQRKENFINHGRHNRTHMYSVQETQLHNDSQQEEAEQETRTQEILQVVQRFCFTQRVEVI